jgi:hypothetical protein
MFHAALHLMTSLPVPMHAMLHSVPQHLGMWQQSLPDSVTGKLGQPNSFSGPSTRPDWTPYNNTFRPETGGCVDSPEAATFVLMAVGALGLAAGSWIYRKVGWRQPQIRG